MKRTLTILAALALLAGCEENKTRHYVYPEDGSGGTSTTSPTPPPEPEPTPTPTPDTQPPSVGFVMPSASTSPTVAVLAFTASDNVGVTGYALTTSAVAPATSSSAWTASAPASYVFPGAGARAVVAWAKDAAGNVSAGALATVLITDVAAPVIADFVLSTTSASPTVAVSSLTVADDFAVAGYLINESATTPAATAAGWVTAKPASLVATAGAHTFHAWAKDAAGNVSESRSASVTITLP